MPNLTEVVVLLVLAVVVLGPDRLPEYAGKLGQLVRSLRRQAQGAQSQVKEELGDTFGDVDWRTYDPRQYDPRRIIRDAWLADDDHTEGAPPEAALEGQEPTGPALTSGPPIAPSDRPAEGRRGTAFDPEAT